jgi:hypothetical protein
MTTKLNQDETEPYIYCTHPNCGKVAAEIVNGTLEWRCRHSGETHVNFISVEALARKLEGMGYVLMTFEEFARLLLKNNNPSAITDNRAAVSA